MSWFRDQATEAIRKSGGRMTAQRQLVIDLLETLDGQLDAEALFQMAHARDPHVSIATVYRTLSVLEDARLVQQRYQSREHVRRFYERASTAPAYHFTCRSCHKIITFHSTLIEELGQRLATELGLSVYGACLCLDGLCPDCRKRAESEPQDHEIQSSVVESALN